MNVCKIFLFFLLTFSFSSTFANNIEGTPFTLENTRVHQLQSNIIDQQYEVRIALPGAYFENPTQEFPIVYVLDGQWNFTIVHDINGKLSYDTTTPAVIIAAITWGGESPNYDALRARDFTISENPAAPMSGGANNFLRILKEEIIPFTESLYPANGHRTLMGASLGGLFTSYALLEKPELFDGYIALAAPYVFEQQYFTSKLDSLKGSQSLDNKRLYLAVGSLDFNVPLVQGFSDALDSSDLIGLKKKFKIHNNVGHAGAESIAYTYGLQHVFKPKTVKVSSKIIQSYEGVYTFVPEAPTLTVSSDSKGRLVVEQEGAQPITMRASSETEFFYYGANISIVFEASGDVMNMHVNSQGNQFLFSRELSSLNQCKE